MGFEVIKTQEELDNIISERLKREREKLTKQFADYDELKTKNVDLEKELTELKKSLESSASNKTELEKQIEELTGKVKANDLSSLKIILYLGSYFFIKLISKRNASFSDSVTIYSNVDIFETSAFVLPVFSPLK